MPYSDVPCLDFPTNVQSFSIYNLPFSIIFQLGDDSFWISHKCYDIELGKTMKSINNVNLNGIISGYSHLHFWIKTKDAILIRVVISSKGPLNKLCAIYMEKCILLPIMLIKQNLHQFWSVLWEGPSHAVSSYIHGNSKFYDKYIQV